MERDERKRHLTARSPDYIQRSGPKKKPRTCSEFVVRRRDMQTALAVANKKSTAVTVRCHTHHLPGAYSIRHGQKNSSNWAGA